MRAYGCGLIDAFALGHTGVDMWHAVEVFTVVLSGPAGRSAEVICRLPFVLEIFTSRMHAWSSLHECGICVYRRWFHFRVLSQSVDS